MRESVGKDGAAHVVDFDLPRGGKARLLEAEVETADAGEQAADGGFWFNGSGWVGVLSIHVILSQVGCSRHSY